MPVNSIPSPHAAQQTGRYFVHSNSGSQQVPLVCKLENNIPLRKALLRFEPIAALKAPVRLGLLDPVPKNPVLADYLSEPQPVVSKTIKDAIESIQVPSVEFVPAQVEVGVTTYPYWLLHTLRSHDVVDEPRSEITRNRFGRIAEVNKLAIDYEKLNAIPPQERLVFLLGNSPIIYLWHESVVEAIRRAGATGITFHAADFYDQDSVFHD